MLFPIYKKRVFIFLIIVFCFVTVFSKIQIANAEGITELTTSTPETLAQQVSEYLTNNYPTPPVFPFLNVTSSTASSTEVICLTNDISSLKGMDKHFCDKVCIGTYLTHRKTVLATYIKEQHFDYIKSFAKDLMPNQKNSEIKIQANYSDNQNKKDIRDIHYNFTVCGSGNVSSYADGYQSLIGSLSIVNNLEDVANAFNIAKTVNPNECTPLFISRFGPELNNFPFSIYKEKEKDICKSEYFNKDNIDKAKQCLTNLANDLEADKDSPSLNPYNDPKRANDIQNLVDAIKKFADCPNLTNLTAIASAQIAELSGVTSYTSTSVASSGCAPNDCLCKAASEHVSIFSPGTWIRAIFAAIAVGIQTIMAWIANTFVWSFTDLPKKLGGYINFKPIYDASSRTGTWYTMLDFANLGIVLGMIFMAIATIFRLEKYSWKQMLPKLLLVALLVNFSLVIIGIFVDISNYLSMTFLSQSTNNSLGSIIEQVVTNVSCSIYNLNPTSFVTTMTAISLALILSTIFIFQFAGLLFYVASRITTIWICAATSPLAFLGMIIDFEPVKKAVNMWRDRFTQAIISLPILAFTLYFVLTILSGQNGIAAQINAIKTTGQNINFILLVAYSVVIISLAQVLRFVAKSIGVEQIEQGYALAKKAVTGALMAGTAAIGGAALTGIAGTQTFRKIGQGLTQMPVLNKVGYKMLDQSDAARFTNIRKSEDKMKLRSKDEIMSIANGNAPSRMNKQAYADYMAARSIALKNGWLKHNDKALDAIRRDIKNNNPDLNAKDIVRAFPQYFKFGKNGKIETIDPKDVKAVADNIKSFSPEDMPKNAEEIMKSIIEAGGDIDEFLKEMVFAKTNQIRAFFDNVSEDEYITGKIFGGTSANPKPWAGENGEIINRLRDSEIKAKKNYEDLFDKYRKQGLDDAKISSLPDVIDALNKWMEDQSVLDELNTKLGTSPSLQDTLKARKV